MFTKHWIAAAFVSLFCHISPTIAEQPTTSSSRIVIEVQLLAVQLPRSVKNCLHAVGQDPNDESTDYGSVKDIGEFISKLRELATVKVIAKPSLTVQDGLAGRMHMGEQVPFETLTKTEEGVVKKVDFVRVGTDLEVEARVTRDGKVVSDLHLEVSKVPAGTAAIAPRKAVTQVNTTITSKSGESRIIAGLLEDINESVRNELLIIATPRLVKAAGQKATQVDPPAVTATVGDPSTLKLTYDGKSFEQWRTNLVSELNPTKRAEAIKAVSVFGANGRATEAAQAIITVLSGYSTAVLRENDISEEVYDETEEQLLELAQIALIRIGPDAAPVLIDTVKNKKGTYARYAAALTLAMIPPNEKVVDAVIAMFDDPKDLLFQLAVGMAKEMKDKSPRLIKPLAKVLANEEIDAEIRCDAAGALADFKESAREALPGMIRLLDSEGLLEYQVAGLVSNIERIGPVKRETIRALLGVLEKIETQPQSPWIESYSRAKKSNGRRTLYPSAVTETNNQEFQPILSNLPKESVAVLAEIAESADESNSIRHVAITILRSMGPRAKTALPVLRKLTEDKRSRLDKAASLAVESITR